RQIFLEEFFFSSCSCKPGCSGQDRRKLAELQKCRPISAQRVQRRSPQTNLDGARGTFAQRINPFPAFFLPGAAPRWANS
ncbi:hypothetical protein L345_02565, partial [Ophiophagus hannah]